MTTTTPRTCNVFVALADKYGYPTLTDVSSGSLAAMIRHADLLAAAGYPVIGLVARDCITKEKFAMTYTGKVA